MELVPQLANHLGDGLPGDAHGGHGQIVGGVGGVAGGDATLGIDLLVPDVRNQLVSGSHAAQHVVAGLQVPAEHFGGHALGAGETIELATRHLHANNIKHVIIANRSIDRAQTLAEQFGGEAIALPQIPEYLPKADIIISSTASPLPILGKGAVEKALKKRKHKPMFMVDIAVPRDVEEEVSELDDVYLYTVDDLQEIIQENLESRQQAAEQAAEIIDIQVEHFLNWQRSLEAVDIIRDMREYAEAISHEVLAKAQKQLAQGKPAEEVLNFLAHTLTNKFLHIPSTQLRQAGQDSHHELIEMARSLLLGQEPITPPQDKK